MAAMLKCPICDFDVDSGELSCPKCGLSRQKQRDQPAESDGDKSGIKQRVEPKDLVQFRQRHLNERENIIEWGVGYIGQMMGKGDNKQHNGVLVVTEERVVFYGKAFFSEVIESLPLASITSIERKSSIGPMTVRLHASNDSLEFKTLLRDQGNALVKAIEAGRAKLTSRSVAPVGRTDDSPIEALQKLAQLRDGGIISHEDFEAKKIELLARI
jgi:hypothetical protein